MKPYLIAAITALLMTLYVMATHDRRAAERELPLPPDAIDEHAPTKLITHWEPTAAAPVAVVPSQPYAAEINLPGAAEALAAPSEEATSRPMIPRSATMRRGPDTDSPPAPGDWLAGRGPAVDNAVAPSDPLQQSIDADAMEPPIAAADEHPVQLVTHAAGAIEAELPRGWRVYEVADERRLHAVLVPPEAEVPRGQYRQEGLWFSHVAVPASRPWTVEDLGEVLSRRLRDLPGEPVVLEADPPATIGPWEALSVVYRLTRPDPSRPAGSPADRVMGRFMVVRTAWGIVEINAACTQAAFRQRQLAYQQVLQSMKLAAPSLPQPLVPRLAAARELLGSWKSSQARMRLYGDARFEIILDWQHAMAIHGGEALGPQPEVRRLGGRFEIENDLLLVRFDDGTLANYRWKQSEGELLLTDHEGRISRLARIYE